MNDKIDPDYYYCFFFQAEDGIRDHCVTGVQTCALPILMIEGEAPGRRRHRLPLLLLSSPRAAASAALLDYVGGGRSEGDHPRASPGIGPVRRGDQRTRAAVLPIRRRQDREVPRRQAPPGVPRT